MKFKKNARIGIWGYGIVGKAAAEFFYNQGYQINVMDKRKFSYEELENLRNKNGTIYNETDKNQFFISHDYLFSSPGVNIAFDYPTHKHKWLQELDLFAAVFGKPIIAVTGSIGKTSVTTMLADVLKLAHIPTCVGGNIGTATFDLLGQKDSIDCALLEVSSFQLEHCTTFAPQLAIWTNFYPNHLDHHATEQDYFLAKYAIMKQQTDNQQSLVHLSLRDRIPKNNTCHMRSYFSSTKPIPNTLEKFTKNERAYFVENNVVMRYSDNNCIPLITLNDELLTFSFLDNIVLLTAACDLLNLNPQILYQIPTTSQLPEHRLEKVATLNGIDFYNDSKSTTTASTLAAVEKLKDRPLHLFVGGLSKGVNRGLFIAELKQYVKYIYCFGEEASELYKFCIKNQIPAQQFPDLDSAFTACIANTKNGDTVLFSPAGSSYDLYKNYEERGTHFKTLIKK
jgi:UDP-N-acetylmuramoylalanine--D-glutamate ligase